MRYKRPDLFTLLVISLGIFSPVVAASAQLQTRPWVGAARHNISVQNQNSSAKSKAKAPEVFDLAQQIYKTSGAAIWPGFDFSRYSRLQENSDASQLRFTSQPNNPSPTIFMVVGDDYFLSHSLEEGLGITFHEAFHGFERDAERPGAKWRYENAFLVAEYPETSARNNALVRVESLILFSALQETGRSSLKNKLRQFITVRKLRQSEMEQRFVEFEKGAESNEGLAEYAGTRAVVAGIDAVKRKRLAAAFKNSDSRAYLLEKFATLKSITQAGRNARIRYYYSGAAQGFLLDRLLDDWKTRIQMNGSVLQDLVEEAANPVMSKQMSVEAILSTYGYETLLKEEEAAATRKEIERRTLLDSMLSQPGRSYVIDVSALGSMGEMRSFDPMNVVMVGKDKRVHTRMLQVGEGDIFSANFAQPVVADFESHKYLTTVKPDQKQEIIVDGVSLNPGKPNELQFRKKLTITSEGFKFEAQSGTVLVTDKAVVVKVTAP